jgi:signal transduction histidine kinase
MSAIRVEELAALQGAQIQQEQMAKVRFQMRAKNVELQQIADQLSTTQRLGIIGFIVLIVVIGFVIYRAKKESQLRIEKTRNRISQDLHDDLSASLNSISFYAGALKTGESNGNTENFLQ